LLPPEIRLAKVKERNMPDLEETLFGWPELLVTSRGELIRVDRSGSEIAVILEAPNGEALARAALRYPSGGPGAELLLSPNERYLALYLYSGQSEEGYELFYFRPLLEHICSFGLVPGEGYVAFSSDERWFGHARSTNPELCLLEKGVEHLSNGECLVDWATLRVQELPPGRATSCNLRVHVGPGFPLEGGASLYPEGLEIVEDEARFHTGWGEQVCAPLPLASSLIIPGPQRR
jgi:hypothetical protein